MSQQPVYGHVVDIVRRVLRLDAVDPRADFFDLGAVSLSLLQIVELVEQECGAVLTITDAFDVPDIDSFARLACERAGG